MALADRAAVSLATRQPIRIEFYERVFIAGMTGSGKTFWTMHMLATQPRLVVIDLKRSPEIAKWDWREPDREAINRLERGKAARVRVQEEEQALEWIDRAYQAGDCVVYIDEIYALIPQGSRTPDELRAVWTRGRELGVGGWASTQRPAWLPRELISEADWTVCFRLKLKDDRAKMAETMGEEALEPITDTHGFFISRTDWPTPAYYSGLNTMRKDEAK